jgi:hypothetical protein
MPHLYPVEVRAARRAIAVSRGFARRSPRTGDQVPLPRRLPVGADPWRHFQPAIAQPISNQFNSAINSKIDDLSASVQSVAYQSNTVKNSEMSFSNNGLSVIVLTITVQPGTTVNIQSDEKSALHIEINDKSAAERPWADQAYTKKHIKIDIQSATKQTTIDQTITMDYPKFDDQSATLQTTGDQAFTKTSSKIDDKSASELTNDIQSNAIINSTIGDISATMQHVADQPNTMTNSMIDAPKIDDLSASVQTVVDQAFKIDDDMPSIEQTSAVQQSITMKYSKINDLPAAELPFAFDLASLPMGNDPVCSVGMCAVPLSGGVCRDTKKKPWVQGPFSVVAVSGDRVEVSGTAWQSTRPTRMWFNQDRFAFSHPQCSR